MVFDRALDPLGNPSNSVFALAYLNSSFETGIRSPLDTAILQCSRPKDAESYGKRDEIPYDFERRRLSIVVEHESHRILISKGAPEGLFALSSNCDSGERVVGTASVATGDIAAGG